MSEESGSVLQAEAYARCLFEDSHAGRSPGWIDNQVAMRSRRHERLRDPTGHALGAIRSAKETEGRDCTVRFAHLRSTALSHVEPVVVVRQVMDAM
ncbi:Scr1 family TA system antitoxin-like transcriptional regulator [Saccharopolyspora taberi]|uniref:DUF5753 domain-containing protein n=1 Tax=Saccharopolyspora taberi TaxID=60895 RepID=A0ABN3V549_9PSEU